MTRTRRLLTIVLSVFSLLLVASAGFAASRPDVAVHRAETESPPAPGDDGQGEDEQDADQGTEHDGTAAGDATAVDPEREAACNEAAGIAPADGGTTGTSGDGSTGGTVEEPTKLTGLDNAIAHVLANCLKNQDAPGLVNALKHLVANQAKHEAHDAAKAERKAEHDARKAEHGHGGGHGNPHADGGGGEPHGNPHGGGHGNH